MNRLPITKKPVMLCAGTCGSRLYCSNGSPAVDCRRRSTDDHRATLRRQRYLRLTQTPQAGKDTTNAHLLVSGERIEVSVSSGVRALSIKPVPQMRR
jgi:hypothetical protein